MRFDEMPKWIVNLEIEDLNFIKKFIFSSGSLKEMASDYGVSYPTMRIRLDRLIDKVRLYDSKDTDVYIEKIKAMAIDDKIDFETAKILIQEYRKVAK